MNPSTAFAVTLIDELVRCGLRDAVLAPGSRSAPLAIALWERAAQDGELRLQVRIDERSAGFLALGLAKASGRPVAMLCTSGTAAANFHPAVIEADESGVPLLVLTADRPPELRGTGANQAIDQVKLYGGAVRWFAEAGVPEARPGMNAYWRSLACRAWAAAAGADGGLPGPVHLNLPLRDPLVPGLPDPAGDGSWPEPLDGRAGGAPWTRWAAPSSGPVSDGTAQPGWSGPDGPGTLDLPWTERGVIVAGDGAAGAPGLLRLAATAGWPVLAEPSSGARQGPHALAAYQYLLEHPGFLAANRPDLVICAGRPGLSRGQAAFLRQSAADGARQVVLAQGPARWADPARTATDVAAVVRLAGAPPGLAPALAGRGTPASGAPGWLGRWQEADAAARGAADAVLDAGGALTEPRLARDLGAALPDGALLWAASSLPIRDLDRHLAVRDGLLVLASRGASGIDGLISSASGAALAHQAAGGGPAAALLGDLAFLHDAPGLFAGPEEARPDLVLVVANNDGGGIFSSLEQAAVPAPFERVFGTPHRAQLAALAAAAGIGHIAVTRAADLPAALKGDGIRIVEVPADRAAGTALRRRLAEAAAAAVTTLL
ncbi:MAG TPA: 2-succinyl-5-enolpyruvyl-6-hydroxy-3-cyclohexene-1-carboxylic-acid synthase [Streptosporangiaceae bacterium]|nr:2-succinyl-5-enolpyruvyl-6-hydroxy-3-cyclohexene-1-carboxylic-acid synthase [Streptosporangiaceae bacterium]